MKQGVTVLSFDVGIRHLAYCKLEDVNAPPNVMSTRLGRIAEWDVIDLGTVKSVEECSFKLASKLEELFSCYVGDFVIIERQPRARSIIMVAIQMLLCSYFTVLKVRGAVGDVRFASASNKLRMMYSEGIDNQPIILDSRQFRPAVPKKGNKKEREKEDRKRYAANKKYAIDATQLYLGPSLMADDANLKKLARYKKKDDLCDAFLQAVAFVEVKMGGVSQNDAELFKRSDLGCVSTNKAEVSTMSDLGCVSTNKAEVSTMSDLGCVSVNDAEFMKLLISFGRPHRLGNTAIDSVQLPCS
jgi:hypothetical protein